MTCHVTWQDNPLRVTVTKYNTYKESLTAYNNTNNSAFIINIITVFCLLTLHKIKPPNNLITNT